MGLGWSRLSHTVMFVTVSKNPMLDHSVGVWYSGQKIDKRGCRWGISGQGEMPHDSLCFKIVLYSRNSSLTFVPKHGVRNVKTLLPF